MTPADELELSKKIEDILVARNLRGMKTVQPHLEPGYCLRAARILRDCRGIVLIGTGFPVVETFEQCRLPNLTPMAAVSLHHPRRRVLRDRKSRKREGHTSMSGRCLHSELRGTLAIGGNPPRIPLPGRRNSIQSGP